ncbi:MAG: DUF1801 domain-containing protein, partial [Planktomarina sp.]
EETRKWGQPSFTDPGRKLGTPIRIGQTKSGDAALFVHCQTTVVADFRATVGQDLRYDGNRALLIGDEHEVPSPILRAFITAALTYRTKR